MQLITLCHGIGLVKLIVVLLLKDKKKLKLANWRYVRVQTPCQVQWYTFYAMFFFRFRSSINGLFVLYTSSVMYECIFLFNICWSICNGFLLIHRCVVFSVMSKEIVLLPDGLVVKERNLGENRINFFFFSKCVRPMVSSQVG